MDEFEVIARYFDRHGPGRDDVAVGIGDDAACVTVADDMDVVATLSTLAPHAFSVHSASQIGHLALAVPLTRLAAAGATPAWATLALTLTAVDEDWLEEFSRGFLSVAREFGVELVGGDTTHGPMSVSVSAYASVPRGEILSPAGAHPGDGIYVTRRETGARDAAGLHLPLPPVAEGRCLRTLASACTDACGGLATAIQVLLTASGVGARVPGKADSQQDLSSLCFTANPERLPDIDARLADIGARAQPVGTIEPRPELRE